MTEANRAPNILPTVVVLGVLLWIFTMTGGRQILVNEILSEAYDGSDWVDGAIAAILFFQVSLFCHSWASLNVTLRSFVHF